MLTAAGVGAGGVLAAWWWLFRRPIPRTRGRLRAPSLATPATVARDRRGIPRISATNRADACLAQGFVHAQDRLWQMELSRRAASGRLSELFGARALDADRFLRRVGLRRAAEAEAQALLPVEGDVLAAYAAGVNNALASLRGRLPLEFTLLRIRPEPWTPVDTLAIGKLMALELDGDFEAELLRARLIAKLGPERAAAIDPCDAARWSGAELRAADPVYAEAARIYARAREFMPAGGAGASNCWAVAGRRTAGGKPLLASDPHLSLRLPSVWHEARLTCPDFDVWGAGIPGIPGVVIGRNHSVAWGMTAAYADTQDLYLERLDRDGRCLQGEAWVATESRDELIRVRGAADAVERVITTRHGPVIAEHGGHAIALRWAAHSPGHTVEALLGLATARDAAAARAALRHWHAPTQNLVFADADGHIGWVMAGTIPLRGPGPVGAPLPGWSDAHEWRGSIPFEEQPQCFDPADGIVVTANQEPPSDSSPHRVGWAYHAPHRANRIRALLEERGGIDVARMAAIQLDLACAPGATLAAAARGWQAHDDASRRVRDALAGWDGQARADSGGAAAYEVVVIELARAAFAPALGDELCAEVLGATSPNPLLAANQSLGRYTGLIARAAATRDETFVATLGAQPWDALIATALRSAAATLERRLGRDPRLWRWGDLHRAVLAHPMAGAPWLRALFPRRIVALGGDVDTVAQSAVLPHRAYDALASAPSYRMVADLGDPTAGGSVLPGGQWGLPRSRHWADQLAAWSSGRLLAPWREDDARRILRLEP
jgi:penicillin amidase